MAVAEGRALARGRPIGVGWALGVLAALAIFAVGTVTGMVLTRPETIRSVEEVASGGSIYTADELAVMELVARGYIPKETLSGEPYRTKALVNQGLIPAQALEPRVIPRPSLYTAQERTLMSLAARGLIPEETVDTRTFLLKRLVNQGLIPWQTLLPRE